jgi:hypothetical protein
MAEEMGYCEMVETIEIGSDRVTVFRQGMYTALVINDIANNSSNKN